MIHVIPTCYKKYLNTKVKVYQKLATLEVWESESKTPVNPEMGKRIKLPVMAINKTVAHPEQKKRQSGCLHVSIPS